MPFCSRCGRQVEEHASFCSNCGTPLTQQLIHPAQPIQPLVSSSSYDRYFSKSFVYSICISILLILSMFAIGSDRGNQVTIEEAIKIQTEMQREIGNLTGITIFFNNVYITLISFIPIIGSAWMLFVQYNSGYLVGSIAKAYEIDFILAVTSLLLSPIGLLEYSAYSLALGESFILVYSALRKNIRKRFKHTWKTIFIVVGLLLIGGIIESILVGIPII